MKRPPSMNPSWQSPAPSSVIPSTRMYGKPVPGNEPMGGVQSMGGGGRQMTSMPPSSGVPYMKSPIPPPQQQHMSVGQGVPKKIPQPIFDDEKRKIQTDSDAAIEGLMSLKSVTQNIPQNDGASSNYESPEKRRKLF